MAQNHNACPTTPTLEAARARSGQILVTLAVLLSALMGILGLVIDGSLLMAESRHAQHLADAAAMAAALDLLEDEPPAVAVATATAYVREHNQAPDADVVVHIPPVEGQFAGMGGYVEVVVTTPVETWFIHVLGINPMQSVVARGVAGYEATTGDAAIVVLDPSPSAISISPVPLILPSAPAIIGGLEVLGQGQVRVEGAVLVNTEWGGVDEDGNPAGAGPGPPYGVSCTPILPLTRLLATDIRVVGGVDDPANYENVTPGETSPLAANRRPVPDPLGSLPVPTVASDPANVSTQLRGGVSVNGLPLIGPPVTLQPGVYEWIEVSSGIALCQEGIYIIRGVNPSTGIALNVQGGQVVAEGVMFYITNSTAYAPESGLPDADDGEATPPPPVAQSLPSSVVIVSLLGSRFTPLSDPSSPFDGMLIYQRRLDRRPIVIGRIDLVQGAFAGTVYAKWGHVSLLGNGTYNSRFVAGTMRVVEALDCRISPPELLPPAEDVFLVE